MPLKMHRLPQFSNQENETKRHLVAKLMYYKSLLYSMSSCNKNILNVNICEEKKITNSQNFIFHKFKIYITRFYSLSSANGNICFVLSVKWNRRWVFSRPIKAYVFDANRFLYVFQKKTKNELLSLAIHACYF